MGGCGHNTMENRTIDARDIQRSGGNKKHVFQHALALFLILENGTFNGSSEAERKTQSYYLSCLNTQRIEELGAQPLIDVIAKVVTTSGDGHVDER